MYVTMEQIQHGASAYFESDICQKLTGVEKFVAYMALPSVPNIVKGKIEKFRQTAFLDDIFDDRGMADIDIAKERATNAMQKCGSIEVGGFRIGQSDIDRIYDLIRRA